MSARELYEKILGIRSFTVIDHLLQTALESGEYNPEELGVLKEIYNEQALDERYAICHDQLGQHEQAQELRAFFGGSEQTVHQSNGPSIKGSSARKPSGRTPRTYELDDSVFNKGE